MHFFNNPKSSFYFEYIVPFSCKKPKSLNLYRKHFSCGINRSLPLRLKLFSSFENLFSSPENILSSFENILSSLDNNFTWRSRMFSQGHYFVFLPGFGLFFCVFPFLMTPFWAGSRCRSAYEFCRGVGDSVCVISMRAHKLL